MSKKQQKQLERQLIDLLNHRSNENRCGECSAVNPTWASYSLGMFLCGRCASAHRRVLGPPNYNISLVQSLSLDVWTFDQIDSIRRIGNRRAMKKWNSKREPFPFDGDDDIAAVEAYLRDKYILRKFCDDSRSSREDSSASPVSSYGRLRLSSLVATNLALSVIGRSRDVSLLRTQSAANVPRLTHRKLTPFESTLFPAQVAKVMSFGFSDRDAVLESLIIAEGIMDTALDILARDAQQNPLQNEIAPALPKRPLADNSRLAAATASNTNALSVLDEWWNTSNSIVSQPTLAPPQPQSMGSVSPQIYQYTDPITGQVSFVDSNGQQYLDPSNPQHQQQLISMTNPQIVAQQTAKQNILSLYSLQQPTGLSQPLHVQQSQVMQAPGFMQPQQPQSTGFMQPQQPQSTGFMQPQQPLSTGFPTQHSQQMQMTYQGANNLQAPIYQQQQQMFASQNQNPQQQQYAAPQAPQFTGFVPQQATGANPFAYR